MGVYCPNLNLQEVYSWFLHSFLQDFTFLKISSIDPWITRSLTFFTFTIFQSLEYAIKLEKTLNIFEICLKSVAIPFH